MAAILIALAAVAAVALIALFLYDQNNHLVITKIELCAPELRGLRIVHLSDLHGKCFGKDNKKLLSKLAALSPDVILFTGDIVYKRKPDLSRSLPFIKAAAKLAPFYFVSGNHEHWGDDYTRIVKMLEECGARSLEDKSTLFHGVTLAGSIDGGVLKRIEGEKREAFRARERERMLPLKALRGEGYSILLSHRPELVGVYRELGFDLVLCGHAHGGQFRLPFIGGVFSPGQGLFPRYSAGLHKLNEKTSMVISRGLGGSLFPFRLFNYPEIILISGRAAE